MFISVPSFRCFLDDHPLITRNSRNFVAKAAGSQQSQLYNLAAGKSQMADDLKRVVVWKNLLIDGRDYCGLWRTAEGCC
jgi:hypothetical protein